MILDYYRIFYYVAQYKSFSKAADVMGNNQPNITRCMNILENELGCKLFIRSNRGVQLTIEGERLFEHVSIAIEQLVSGENELLKDKGLESGLVNIGAEEEKGNALVKETYPLLKECKDINFIGNVEARDIPAGVCDVIVCEAFVGNVILKLYEGTASALVHQIKKGMVSTLRSKIGALLVKPALKTTLKTFDATQYGGAPMLGLKGLVVKTHGSATSKEIKHAIFQCTQFSKERINEKIKEHILEETN